MESHPSYTDFRTNDFRLCRLRGRYRFRIIDMAPAGKRSPPPLAERNRSAAGIIGAYKTSATQVPCNYSETRVRILLLSFIVIIDIRQPTPPAVGWFFGKFANVASHWNGSPRPRHHAVVTPPHTTNISDFRSPIGRGVRNTRGLNFSTFRSTHYAQSVPPGLTRNDIFRVNGDN